MILLLIITCILLCIALSHYYFEYKKYRTKYKILELRYQYISDLSEEIQKLEYVRAMLKSQLAGSCSLMLKNKKMASIIPKNSE